MMRTVRASRNFRNPFRPLTTPVFPASLLIYCLPFCSQRLRRSHDVVVEPGVVSQIHLTNPAQTFDQLNANRSSAVDLARTRDERREHYQTLVRLKA